MKVTAAAPDPSPKPPTPPARAVQFFRRCGYSPEDAAVMARIAAEARIPLAAESQETVTPGRRAMTAPAMQQARSLHEVCEAARLVNCGECWTAPGKPCTPEGDHVARFGRAMRRGLLSGPDLVAVLGQLDAFTTATVVETPGGSL
jgi:hypothetical protein